MFNTNITALPMRRSHDSYFNVATLLDNPSRSISQIEELIIQEEVNLQVSQALQNREEYFDARERIIDLKSILCALRSGGFRS
jgi:hypothetical protein